MRSRCAWTTSRLLTSRSRIMAASSTAPLRHSSLMLSPPVEIEADVSHRRITVKGRSVTVALRLLTPRHVLECPGVAIGVGERGVEDTAEILDRGHLHTAVDQRGAGGLDVADDQVQTAQAARGHVERGDSRDQRDRACRTRGSQLDDPYTVGGPHVDIHCEPDPFGVKGLGPVDVADGHQYELEQETAGTHRGHRVSRAIGFGHGITITTRGSRERDGPEPYGLVVRLLT